MSRDADASRGQLLDGLTAIASEAAAAILAVCDPAGSRRDKADLSPVTAADEAAEAAVLAGVTRLLPGVPIVSEESGVSGPGPLGDRFLMIDPLDGTRELLAGESEYAVNIALIEHGVPVIGVIAAPALGLIWRGVAGQGAERLVLTPGHPPARADDRRPIAVRHCPAEAAIAAVSRFHPDADTDRYLTRFPRLQRVVIGSAIKFCRLAEGAIDVYARMSRMSEWDIAAGHAIVTAAGGTMTDPKGAPLVYGHSDFLVHGFVARGGSPA